MCCLVDAQDVKCVKVSFSGERSKVKKLLVKRFQLPLVHALLILTTIKNQLNCGSFSAVRALRFACPKKNKKLKLKQKRVMDRNDNSDGIMSTKYAGRYVNALEMFMVG